MIVPAKPTKVDEPDHVVKMRNAKAELRALAAEQASKGKSTRASSIQQSNDAGSSSIAVAMETLGLLQCVDRSKDAAKWVSGASARTADRALVTTYRGILAGIGKSVNSGMHQAAEPPWLGRFNDRVFHGVWPEVTKQILDDLLLAKGFSLAKFRTAASKDAGELPSGCVAACRAVVLHAMNPFDLSFWGRMRYPLYCLIYLVFLFPYYGIDDTCMVVFWLCIDKCDEHQVVSFILLAKSFQFVTGGLMSGSYAFLKLYLCATHLESDACATSGPGMYWYFDYVFALFMLRSVRCTSGQAPDLQAIACLARGLSRQFADARVPVQVLVWISFAILCNFDYLLELKKTHDARAARMLTSPRRGLLPQALSLVLVVTTWLIFGIMMSKHPLLTADDSASSGSLAYTTLAITILQLAISYLLMAPVPTVHYAAFVAACTAALSGGTALGQLSVWPDEQAWLLAWAVASLVASVGLAAANVLAQAEDDKNLAKLESILQNLDRDGDGQVTRPEFEMYFAQEYPGVVCDTVWKQADTNGPTRQLTEPKDRSYCTCFQ